MNCQCINYEEINYSCKFREYYLFNCVNCLGTVLKVPPEMVSLASNNLIFYTVENISNLSG